MTTAYTPILKLALPVTGELNGTWGDVVNQNITSMVEQAIAGLATINTWTANSHTLTTADGTTSESRCAILVCDDDGAGNPSAAATVICPAATKAYIVQNLTGQTVTVKTAAGSGVAVPNNQSALLFCNGTNVVTGAFNGDVVGPATATDNAIARYDLTTGKLIQNSGVTIDDSNNMAGVAQLSSTSVVTGQVDITGQGDLRLQDTTGGEYVALQAPATLATSYTLTLPIDDGTNGQALITDGNGVLSWSSAASGDVYGPASATDEALARFDGTTGKIIQNSVITATDAGTVSGVTQLNVDNLRLDGNTVSSTDTNGNINVTPNGTGAMIVGGNASFTSTGAIKIPVGTLGERPTPAAGMLRFNTGSNEFEGYNGTAWASVGGSAISNDTSTATDLYPSFLNATTGTAANIYTSNAKLLYKPSTGEFKAEILVSQSGIIVNSQTIDTSYTIPAGSNAVSAGPVTIDSSATITVSSGSSWVIV